MRKESLIYITNVEAVVVGKVGFLDEYKVTIDYVTERRVADCTIIFNTLHQSLINYVKSDKVFDWNEFIYKIERDR